MAGDDGRIGDDRRYQDAMGDPGDDGSARGGALTFASGFASVILSSQCSAEPTDKLRPLSTVACLRAWDRAAMAIRRRSGGSRETIRRAIRRAS